MAKYEIRCRRTWLQALTSIVILSCAIAWVGGNPPLAEDTQPDKATASQTNAPDIFLPVATHDFGKLYIGDKVKHSFKIINKGNATLDLIEITTVCDCTGTEPDKWHIEPGGEAVLLISFAPDETTRVGRTAKFVYIQTNDPDTPKYKLKFTANIRRDVVYAPHKFDFGFVSKGDTVAKRVVFKSKLDPEGFEITKATSSSSVVEVSHGKLNDKGEWYVDATIGKDAVIGKVLEKITVFTNSTKLPKIKFQTHAEMLPEVSVDPRSVCFGRMERGQEVVRTITIRHAKGIKVEKVEPSLSWVSVDITTDDDTNDSSLTETKVKMKLISVNAPADKSEGVLRVFTNSQNLPVIKVPLCGNVLESQS